MFNRKKQIKKLNSDEASLISVIKPDHIISEQFRTIRTNIQYSMVDKRFKTIMVTSSSPNEGKSTITSNLASVMSDTGKRILLIDADLRKPVIHKTFKLDSSKGLTSLLTNKSLDVMDVIQYSEPANLYILTPGPIPPNPAELLSSTSMKNLISQCENIFDLIIIDTPPVLAVADAQILADSVDGTIFVIREGVAERKAVKKSIELLQHTGVNIIGSIYNGADISKLNSYYGYNYAYKEDK